MLEASNRFERSIRRVQQSWRQLIVLLSIQSILSLQQANQKHLLLIRVGLKYGFKV
jgi:hypothetical protein